MTTEKKQLLRGTIIQISFRKINQSVATINKKRGFEEIVNSPVFRNFVVSEDGKTSGIIVYLKSKYTNKKFKR